MNNESIQISFKNVFKVFNKLEVLKDINLDINKGEKIVLCGPSGSGKSTLIRCINGLETVDQGSVVVNDVKLPSEVSKLPLLRKSIGMVFQQFNLFPHLTVLKNCTLAPEKVLGLSPKEAKSIAEEYLDRVGILNKANDYPVKLSGGQQQRAAIARALCMSPEIMLFDEPTSALDPEMVSEVLEVMRELTSSGITMICVTHEMRFAQKIADRICFLADGEILEMNNPHEFFTQPKHPRLKTFLSQIIPD